MKTAIRKSYRSKTLRLMNNTMTDTPPGHTLFYTRAIRGGVAGPGGGALGAGRTVYDAIGEWLIEKFVGWLDDVAAE